MLDKLGAGSLYNFLWLHCKAICNVSRNVNGVRISRISNETTAQMDDLTKAQKKNNNKKISDSNKAPKLK